MSRPAGYLDRVLGWLTIGRLVAAIVFVSIFAMAVRVPADSDTWWHLQSGRWIVQHHAVPRTDPFSYTRQGEPWVDHSWLAQIVLYLLFDEAGYAGLGLLVAALATFAFVFVWLQCRQADRWLRAFTMILAATTSSVIWAARPQMFSFVFASAAAYLLDRFRQGDRKAIWWMPPLMVLWVNTHGGFAVGFILLAVHLFGELGNLVLVTEKGDPAVGRAASWRRIRYLALVSGLCLLVVPLNPNGFQMWGYPFRTVGIGVLRDFIAEWRPPDFHQMHLHPFIWMLLAALAGLGLSGRTADWTDLSLVALFAYMSLLAGRNIALFALVTAPVIIRYGGAALAAWHGRRGRVARVRAASRGRLTGGLNWTLLALVLAAAALKVKQPLTVAANVRAQAASLPVEAVEFLRRERPPGPILNSYNWGGYLIWQLAEYPVFVDGRTDLYDDAFLRRYLALVWCQAGWERQLDESDINLVLIEADSTLGRLLAGQPGWRQVYRDETAAVFVRR